MVVSSGFRSKCDSAHQRKCAWPAILRSPACSHEFRPLPTKIKQFYKEMFFRDSLFSTFRSTPPHWPDDESAKVPRSMDSSGGSSS